MYSEIINGVEYRLVTIGKRSKLISATGDAINFIRRNQKCTVYLNRDGYPCFGGGIPVHQYVALGWVDGYFDGAEVNHKDFDRTNYNADNLEWSSHIDNVHYSSDADRYAKQFGEANPNYGNDTLHKKLVDHPELRKEYYARQNIQNGRATRIYVYSKEMVFIREFPLIKECAIWLANKFSKDESKIPHIQSAISMSMKKHRPYKGYLFFKTPQYTQC